MPVSDPYGLPEGAGVLLFKTSAGGAVLSHISGLERLLCRSGRIGGTAIERYGGRSPDILERIVKKLENG